MTEIRIYVEGGGDGKESKARFRQGMDGFLKKVFPSNQRIMRWKVIACGSRNDTYRNFHNALKSHPTAFNVLLVDSEDAVTTRSRVQHLQKRDQWDMDRVDENQCHLMVQEMENWLIADVKALEKFYGQGFNSNAIPANRNVEEISKSEVNRCLEKATRKTQKGNYHKINHAPKLLERINVSIVRRKASHCNVLFETLTTLMNSGE